MLAVVALTLVGCAVTPEPPTPAPSTTVGSFELRILPETWSDDMFHVYELDEAAPLLASFPLDDALAVVTVEDVATYEWDAQRMTLTAAATDRLASVDITQHAFAVTVDGERLLSGIFLLGGSAMGIGYPVAYDKTERGALVVSFRDVHDLGMGRPTGLHRPAIQAIFEAAGKLRP